MRRTLFGSVAVAAVALAALSAPAASAATFAYSFSSNDGLEGAFGTLDASLVSPGEYVATSGTITAFGPVVTGTGTLYPNPTAPAASLSPSGFFIYDDVLLPGQNPLITNPGLLFFIGAAEVNIFSNGPGPGTYSFYDNLTGETLGNFSLTEISGAVPEPASWALMILGFGILGGALRSRSARPAMKLAVRYA